MDTVVVSRPAPGVMLATLDRPDRMNAMTFEMFDEFVELCGTAENDPTVRTLVVTGAGRGFCAGMDLDLARLIPDMPADEALRRQEGWARGIAAFHRLSKPVIAAVNGAAAGAGFALALAADLRLAAPEARFNAAFVKIGFSGSDVGITWMLPRIVGLTRAAEILYTGRFVGAEEAREIGIVNAVSAPGALLDDALEFARSIAANSPFGVRLTKQALLTNVDAPSLESAMDFENRNQILASRTEDMREALAAFVGKRPPRWAIEGND